MDPQLQIQQQDILDIPADFLSFVDVPSKDKAGESGGESVQILHHRDDPTINIKPVEEQPIEAVNPKDLFIRKSVIQRVSSVDKQNPSNNEISEAGQSKVKGDH